MKCIKTARRTNIPSWANLRIGWTYVGWISRNPHNSTFEELIEKAKRSDHGEIREVDIYPEGAVCWVEE